VGLLTAIMATQFIEFDKANGPQRPPRPPFGNKTLFMDEAGDFKVLDGDDGGETSLSGAPTSALTVNKTGEFIFGSNPILVPENAVEIDGVVQRVPGKWVNAFTYTEGNLASGGTRLTSVEFADLVGVLGQFSLFDMAALTTLRCPVLRVVGGNFSATGAPSLSVFEAPSLRVVGGAFQPNNVGIDAMSLPSLQIVTGAFSPNGMSSLVTFSAPALEVVGGNCTPSNMAVLTSLSFPALKSVRGSFQPSSMANVTTVSAPAMVRYGSFITIPSATVGNVTTVTLGTVGTLKQIAGQVTLSGLKLNSASVNGILALLVSLDGTNGTTLWGAGRTLTINGGTNAAPSGQGITDAATLVARGATVTTN
jgi:hypothetical protein